MAVGSRHGANAHEGGHDGPGAPPRNLYESTQAIRPRLGQGAFRIQVVDLYGRRCVVTRERTLPALEAAHIKPYSEGGPRKLNNGLLLRRDIHSLYDSGSVTVTPELYFEVSRRIREEFENGKEYDRPHGSRIVTPDQPGAGPSPSSLAWHNEHCFR